MSTEQLGEAEVGGWRCRRRPEGQRQLTPFHHRKEKAIRSECTAFLSLILVLL